MAEVAFAIFGGNGLQRVTRWARRQPAPADRDCLPRLKAEASRASQAKFPASAERTPLAGADSSPAASGAQKQFGAARALDLRPPAVIIAPNRISRETSP